MSLVPDIFIGEAFAYNYNQLYLWSPGKQAPQTIQSFFDSYLEAGNLADFLCHHEFDCSFVLFDKTKNLTVAAKDFFGVSPLFFWVPEEKLVQRTPVRFSFSIKDLISISGYTVKIDLGKVDDYLCWDKIGSVVSSHTFFHNIYRVLPAHALVIENDVISTFPYSKLSLDRHSNKSNADFIHSFEQQFSKGISKFISPEIKLGASLSGGLDSSSIAAVAQSLSTERISAFHLDFGGKHNDEKKYAKSIADKWRLDLHIHPPPKVNYARIKHSIANTGMLPHGVLTDIASLYFQEPIRQKCDVLLMGEGGDQVVGMHETAYMDELYAKKDWVGLKKVFNSLHDVAVKARKDAPHLDTSFRFPPNLAVTFFYKKINQTSKPGIILRDLWLLFGRFSGFRSNYMGLLPKLVSKRLGLSSSTDDVSLLRKSALQSYANLPDKNKLQLDVQQICSDPLTPNQRNHLEGCFHELLANLMEEMDTITRKKNLKVSFPFLSKELLELCMTVPNEVRFDNGLRRGILRQGLEKYLSPEVRNRGWKAHMSEYGEAAFYELLNGFLKEPDYKHHTVWAIMDKSRFENLVGYIKSGKSENKARVIATRAIYFAIWVDYLCKEFPNILMNKVKAR